MDTTYELHGLDKNSLQQHKLAYFYQWDITTEGNWGFDEEYDVVIHLAAEVAVGRSVKNPTLYYVTNTMGTLNVLKNIRTKRFVHASTGSAGPMNNPYGISKRGAEDIVTQWCTQKEIPFTIFRFFNVTGCDGFNPTNPDGLMWNLMKAQETGVFTVFGSDYNTKDGTPVRDYTHVNEICSAVSTGIHLSSNKIENLGHGVGTTVLEMVDLYKKINRCDFEVEMGPRRAGDLERSVLDNPSSYMQKLYTMEDLLHVSR